MVYCVSCVIWLVPVIGVLLNQPNILDNSFFIALYSVYGVVDFNFFPFIGFGGKQEKKTINSAYFYQTRVLKLYTQRI